MKKMGVVGRGFVGTAVLEGMKHAFDVYSYDRAKGWAVTRGGTSAPAEPGMLKAREAEDEDFHYEMLVLHVDEVVFVCVPTPMNPDGTCSVSVVEDVVRRLSVACDEVGKDNLVVVVKSTVIPGTTARLNHLFDNVRVVFNPEFLTERNFVEDFRSQDRVIVGGPHRGTAVVKQLYETAYPNVPVTKTSSTIAEMVKYVTNCFLATKVSFANEMKQLCDGLEVDFDKVVEYATKDRRLGTSHWSVPGPDGVEGFGGSCFPKDLNGLIGLAGELGVDPKVMRAAWEKNLEVRPGRDWEKLKGRAVTGPSES